MYTSYHFKSAEEITEDFVEKIKSIYKEKPIVLTVEEDINETTFLLQNPVNKNMLLQSIAQDKNDESVMLDVEKEFS